ncbi:nucleoside hydrolase [uncultured Pseudokineococcus sp.]|uniref:nucleoside hydrolase n=1 Tax=uncultured Pseudokineococcus sp. TaxID=1642928 RepID=UPI0026279D01|nr:nucleoside hydrolase [uncultured Pseudokineococcus sp.]
MERLLLDTDLAMGAPGSDIDDGFALALCLADPELALELVTTVGGNTDVDTATTLTLELLDRLGRPEVPVHRGARDPLVRPRARVGSLPDGMAPREPRDEPAAVALVEAVRANPGEMTLVAIGPLTNVALAMRLDPSFAGGLKRLVIMGGVFLQHTNEAGMPGEFNIWCDPEAAHAVLTSGVRADFVGLDVTLRVRVDRAQAASMAASDQPFTAFAGQYTQAWIDHLAERSGDDAVDSCAMHDPLAVAALSRPDLLTWRDAYVAVELGDRLRGAMLADFHPERGKHGQDTDLQVNARVAVDVDAAAFNHYFTTTMGEIR